MYIYIYILYFLYKIHFSGYVDRIGFTSIRDLFNIIAPNSR